MPDTKPGKAIVRKPKQGRSKATVAAILEAGARILAERGWAGFNTNVIAERAGVSIGSLYEYFPNKQALIDEIASNHIAQGEALLLSAATGMIGSDDPGVLVDALVQGLVDLHRDDPRLHRALSSEVPLSPDIRARVETLRQGAIAFVGQALAPHVDTPGVAAQLLVDTADTVVHRWFVEDDGTLARPERMAEELRRMLLAYLAVRSRASRS
ncbi:MAG: TetR/AcrR family transcriptional regulator [Rhodobacteraceae bacterium]|nr:TetR/AcrR family transcriptional regulator [Paracoccaceae bacterium]